ncbi:hypothetical protein FACS189467_3840 [Bacteroidia bacterium]|nr:hypothetical protein FACS189467_3840 [Bacteroidia bacterium]
MNFIETILKYYVRESWQGFGSAIFGSIVIAAAILLFKFANPLSWFRGLTIPFLLVGLIMGLGGLGDGIISRRAIPEKVALFEQDQSAFFSQEVTKVEKTHQSWRGIKIFWSIMTAAGVVLLFVVKKEYWIGVAVGTIVLSIAGHIEEAISKNFNERYYEAVLAEANKYSSATPQLLPSDGVLLDTVPAKKEAVHLRKSRTKSKVYAAVQTTDSIKEYAPCTEPLVPIQDNVVAAYQTRDTVLNKHQQAYVYGVHYESYAKPCKLFARNKE